MKVAVTGASGHIGSCLVRELIKQGDKVKILVHNSRTALDELHVVQIEGDLLDRNSLEQLCKGADVVFHLAAQIAIDRKSNDQVYRTNIEGTRNLIDVCIKEHIPKFIHFSSIHALDVFPLDKVMDENRPLTGKSGMAYEYSKAESERIVLKAAENGLHVVILNPTAVFGPYDYHRSYLGQALIRIYRNSLPVLVHGGYNWVDVRDVVKAAIASVLKGRTGERYILSGHWCSLKELSQLISTISGKKTPCVMAPLLVAQIGLPFIRLISKIRGEHPLYTMDSLDILKHSHRNISCEKAIRELGYNPRPLSESLADTFTWYIQQGFIP
jgi:dihydroflavonol-4-reductase